MTRKTYENIFLACLVAFVCSLSLYNYYIHKKEFKPVTEISFTDNYNSVQLNAPEEKKLNINTASFSQLDALPGISSNIAADIIIYRKKHRFKNIAELAFIKGIGPKKLAALTDVLDCK